MTLPIDFETNPLVPVVIQDDASRDVLMVGFMNQDAFEKTQETGFVHFWSRSRDQLWKKGETSGHTQEVVSMSVNCEDNSLLIQVIQQGAVCHTGHRSCYYRQILPDGSLVETSDPVFDPAEVYENLHPPEAVRRTREKRRQNEDTSFIGAWYGAYEYLAVQPLQDVSNTSKLLHNRVLPFARIADELEELSGVLTGEHGHSGDLAQDVTLEGSQTLYWLNLLAIGLGQEWDRDLGLDNALIPPPRFGEDSLQTLDELQGAIRFFRQADARYQEKESHFLEDVIPELKSTYWLISRAVAPHITPRKLVEHDLDELRSKPYLADYFSSAGA